MNYLNPPRIHRSAGVPRSAQPLADVWAEHYDRHPRVNVRDRDNFPPPSELAEPFEPGPVRPLPDGIASLFDVGCCNNDCDGSGCASCRPF